MPRGRKKVEQPKIVEEVHESPRKKKREYVSNNSGGAVYGLGLLGAAIYYIQNASNFTDGLIGVLKALVWPAFLIYKLFEFLKM